MTQFIECDHIVPIDGNPSIKELVRVGILTLDGGVVENVFCDHRIPLEIRGAKKGQSIACVGPNNNGCPGCEKTRA